MRGIPCGMREDGMNSLTAAFMIPHSGGKHREGAYVSSVGINGEGNKVVCHTAKWLEVTVHRDGSKFYQRFESTDEGATPVCDVVVAGPTQDHTGTEITYQPDAAVYGDIFIDVPALERMLQEMSYFTKGLTIELIVDGVSKTFYSANGLVDGLVNPNAIGKPFSYFYDNGECKVELALQWVTKRGSIKGYANGLYMPNGGAFISGFKTSLTKAFNNLAKSSFDGESIRAMVDGFVSVKVKVGQFSNQAKTALANPEARTATATATTQAIKEWVGKNRSDFDMVVSTLTKIEKAERAAEKARAAVLNHEKEQLANAKRKLVNSDKLRDAKKLGEDSVLLVCEGLSAGGSMSIGRDINKYGILMLRGKAINCLSNSIEDVLENEEVKLMLQALGITYGKPYNSKKLRYGRVAIASDADFDGSHIGLLIMAMLQRLCPEFIQEGRLNWLVPPLYKLAKIRKRGIIIVKMSSRTELNGAEKLFDIRALVRCLRKIFARACSMRSGSEWSVLFLMLIARSCLRC